MERWEGKEKEVDRLGKKCLKRREMESCGFVTAKSNLRFVFLIYKWGKIELSQLNLTCALSFFLLLFLKIYMGKNRTCTAEYAAVKAAVITLTVKVQRDALTLLAASCFPSV